MAAIYQLRTSQNIPASIEDVWKFISSPQNLKKITPEYMGFKITNEPIAKEVYPGMIISYEVTPLLGLPLDWVTEITQVRHHDYFIDEQRVGPYKMWHHEHHIKEIPGGVMMEDIISYIPPFGILGKIANSIFINSQLQNIFDYRYQAVELEFGKFSTQT